MLSWDKVEELIKDCNRCSLCMKRNNIVLDGGNRQADIMFVGEGPGEQEDLHGQVFIGPAGQLLDKMFASIGLDRTKVYISNIVECRPPYNRDPTPEEQKICINFLRAQLLLVKPKIIVCLGRIAAQAIIRPDFRITKEHGLWQEKAGYLMTATYHPSALLRDPSKKKDAYEDLKKIREKLNELN